jgi:hypothetical protein
MKIKHCFLFFIFFTFFVCSAFTQENIENNDETAVKRGNNNTKVTGIALSFSGFNEFRMGVGIFYGELGGFHHPFGYDYGLLFEYNFKEKITYTRTYFHVTGGVGAGLLGASMVFASDNNDISLGFAPEIGFGLSTVFKIFYRYNFYINRDFNSYEVVFHLCLGKRN